MTQTLSTPATTPGSDAPGPITAHWFLPTYGDSRGLVGGGHGMAASAAGASRPADLGYLAQIARAAETVGFEAALTPAGAWCEDAWLTTAMLAAHSERLKFLVAFRPGLVSPTLAAQMAATFQRHSGGRLLLNVVTGGEPAEQRAYGDFLGKDDRYRRCREFLEVVRRLWRGETVDLDGALVPASPARSPPSTPTSTSPGASCRPRWRRSWTGSAAWPPRGAAGCGSASGCTSSPGTPPTRRGRRPRRC